MADASIIQAKKWIEKQIKSVNPRRHKKYRFRKHLGDEPLADASKDDGFFRSFQVIPLLDWTPSQRYVDDQVEAVGRVEVQVGYLAQSSHDDLVEMLAEDDEDVMNTITRESGDESFPDVMSEIRRTTRAELETLGRFDGQKLVLYKAELELIYDIVT